MGRPQTPPGLQIFDLEASASLQPFPPPKKKGYHSDIGSPTRNPGQGHRMIHICGGNHEHEDFSTGPLVSVSSYTKVTRIRGVSTEPNREDEVTRLVVRGP
ncbi:hypothetical protein VUR80DRAFT_899 [Thermomyces stellatus]